MAKASVTGQITVISNGTTFYTVLQCQMGDIYQTYLGDTENPTNITPDFESDGATKPMIVFLAYSSEKANGNGLYPIANQNVHWYINNNTELTFDSQGVSTNNFGGVTGHFTKTTQVIGDITVPALVINKNLVKINDCNSFLINAEATVSVTNSSVHLSGAYQVSITYGTENTKKVTIIAGDTNFFNINEKGGSCKLKAWVDNADAAGLGYTFKWYVNNDGNWELQSEASDVISIMETQVSTSALVKLEVYKEDDLYGMDVQTVNDTSDPYHITPNPREPKGSDGVGDVVIEQFTNGEEKTIRYAPILWYNKDGVRTTVSNQTFKMWLYDNAGVLIKAFDTAAKFFDVTSASIVEHGGSVYIIQTSD